MNQRVLKWASLYNCYKNTFRVRGISGSVLYFHIISLETYG